MTDADPLRRAVLDRPDDDTPRLVYADYLDENGEADRAAFVRSQVEAGRAEPHRPAGPARPGAPRRPREDRPAARRPLRRVDPPPARGGARPGVRPRVRRPR